MTTRNSSKPATTNNRKRKPTAPPEIISVNGQPPQPTDAPEGLASDIGQTDSIAPADAATIGDDILEAAAAPFDLDAYMSEAIQATEAIIAGRRDKAATGSNAGSEPRQRATWPAIAQEAASRAGLRLPGLYPKPGSKSARNGGGAGWYRDAGAGRPPGKNAGIALQTLWERIGRPLAAGQTLPVAALFATVAAVKKVHQVSSAETPEWLQYVIAPNEPRPDGTKVGQATCILHQVALMAGPVIMTTETLRKV